MAGELHLFSSSPPALFVHFGLFCQVSVPHVSNSLNFTYFALYTQAAVDTVWHEVANDSAECKRRLVSSLMLRQLAYCLVEKWSIQGI